MKIQWDSFNEIGAGRKKQSLEKLSKLIEAIYNHPDCTRSELANYMDTSVYNIEHMCNSLTYATIHYQGDKWKLVEDFGYTKDGKQATFYDLVIGGDVKVYQNDYLQGKVLTVY